MKQLSTDTKLTFIILLWIVDKIIMALLL